MDIYIYMYKYMCSFGIGYYMYSSFSHYIFIICIRVHVHASKRYSSIMSIEGRYHFFIVSVKSCYMYINDLYYSLAAVSVFWVLIIAMMSSLYLHCTCKFLFTIMYQVWKVYCTTIPIDIVSSFAFQCFL